MKKKAFTLVEILIVLALVGFLFTLTLPNLIQKEGTRKYIDGAKTAQTKLQEAFDEAAKRNNNKTPQDWKSVRVAQNKSEAIIKEISKDLQIMSYCGDSQKGCFAANGYKTLNGQPTTIIADKMSPYKRTISNNDYSDYQYMDDNESDDNKKSTKTKLKYEEAYPESSSTYISVLNGGAIALKTNSTRCDGIIPSTDPLERPFCGVIYVDVNGPSIPNMLGVDVFGFYLSGSTILPMGFYGDDFSFDYNCLFETPYKRPSNGLACSAWAINNKNMDYRKCLAGKRITWSGATRCDSPDKK